MWEPAVFNLNNNFHEPDCAFRGDTGNVIGGDDCVGVMVSGNQ